MKQVCVVLPVWARDLVRARRRGAAFCLSGSLPLVALRWWDDPPGQPHADGIPRLRFLPQVGDVELHVAAHVGRFLRGRAAIWRGPNAARSGERPPAGAQMLPKHGAGVQWRPASSET